MSLRHFACRSILCLREQRHCSAPLKWLSTASIAPSAASWRLKSTAGRDGPSSRFTNTSTPGVCGDWVATGRIAVPSSRRRKRVAVHKGLRDIEALPGARREGPRGCSTDGGGASSVSCGGAGDFRPAQVRSKDASTSRRSRRPWRNRSARQHRSRSRFLQRISRNESAACRYGRRERRQASCR
jgi:hypothetical protein